MAWPTCAEGGNLGLGGLGLTWVRCRDASQAWPAEGREGLSRFRTLVYGRTGKGDVSDAQTAHSVGLVAEMCDVFALYRRGFTTWTQPLSYTGKCACPDSRHNPTQRAGAKPVSTAVIQICRACGGPCFSEW